MRHNNRLLYKTLCWFFVLSSLCKRWEKGLGKGPGKRVGPPGSQTQDVGWSSGDGPWKGFQERVPGKGTKEGSQKGLAGKD